MKRKLIIAVVALCAQGAVAKDFDVRDFGAKGDGSAKECGVAMVGFDELSL